MPHPKSWRSRAGRQVGALVQPRYSSRPRFAAPQPAIRRWQRPLRPVTIRRAVPQAGRRPGGGDRRSEVALDRALTLYETFVNFHPVGVLLTMIFYPEERLAIFIDGANLYSAARSLAFDIDYKRLLELFGTKGRLIRAFYYTALVEDQEYSPIRPLVDWLDYNGYSMVTKPTKEFTDALVAAGSRAIWISSWRSICWKWRSLSTTRSCFPVTAIFAGWSRRCSAAGCGCRSSRRSVRRRRWCPTICAAKPTISSNCRISPRASPATITRAKTRAPAPNRSRRREADAAGRAGAGCAGAVAGTRLLVVPAAGRVPRDPAGRACGLVQRAGAGLW